MLSKEEKERLGRCSGCENFTCAPTCITQDAPDLELYKKLRAGMIRQMNKNVSDEFRKALNGPPAH